MAVDAVDDGRLQLGLQRVVLFGFGGSKALGSRALYTAAQLFDLLFHFGMFGALADALEV